MLITYVYGWLPVYPPTARLSVCPPPDCPSPFWLSVYFISQLRVCLSIPQSIHSCFSQHPSSFRPPATRLPVYPPDRPSVCLSVCLPVLSCFSANCQSPFRPQAVCLFTGCLSPFLTQTVRRSRVWLTQDEGADSKKWPRFTVLARLLCFMH